MRRTTVVGTLLFALTAVCVSIACMSTVSSAQVGISVAFGPPALPVYEQPICPGDGYIWTPGYWAWDPDSGDYYWVPGTWILAPDVGYLWTPPWWGWEGGRFWFHEGWWGPSIGFYGGINYGFGYFGVGFVGGRWQGDHFFYNRAVTNINVVNIRNVYNERVTINENRVSFNGGPGGIVARPNAEEQAAARGRHIGAVSVQTAHVEQARSNRELRASVNRGRPPIAATGRPGEFSHQVVSARAAGGAYHPPTSRPENGGRTFNHPNELPPIGRPARPNTGDARLDQQYQKQQEGLYNKQNQERQKLQAQQEKEHQQAQQRNYNSAQRQQMEQRHQQQTQQMQQHHQQQSQQLQERQAPRGGGRNR